MFTILERREALSEIIRTEAKKRPMAAIAAISELNKMDRAYDKPEEERPEIKIIEVHTVESPGMIAATSGSQTQNYTTPA